MMEWISVGDRLPTKKDEYYLFGGYTYSGKFECGSDHWRTHDDVNLKRIKDMGYTHWMPLPPPPIPKV